GLINTFIAPRSISGPISFDLTVDGPPALSSVRGRISTQGTQVAAPELPLSFSDISGGVDLTGGQAIVGLTAQVSGGGSVGVNGPVTLDGAFPAQIDVGLNNVVVTDNVNYTSLLNGGISVTGPLTGGAAVGGTIDVGETTVRVPSSTVSTLGAIPDITHIGETRPQLRTRERAGLVATGDDAGSSGGGGSVAFPLDITINAPSRIFIRGRGINAELGGELQISGSTADTISTGEIELIRGRIDVLNRRFDLTEGQVELQGRFEPYVLLVAETTTDTGTASIIVQGPPEDIEVTFESSPEAPQDQILAQIIFGRDISQLSAFQALQLANAVATLAGVGGEGLVSRL
ncbi:MAG: translocation/assembly module TamB domain-containing protein, partial [Pseudomonadota bacterium]